MVLLFIFVSGSTLERGTPLVHQKIGSTYIWAAVIGSSLLTEVTMDPLDQPCVMNSVNCAHMLFEETLTEQRFEQIGLIVHRI